MNFIKDLRTISEQYLKKYNLEYDISEDDRTIIERWINYEVRSIPIAKRKVIISKKIKSMHLTPEIETAFKNILRLFESGADLYPYLSKNISYEDYTDFLFCDWNIYHLHLSTEKDAKNPEFMKRSKHLLFLSLNTESAYFVDIRPHNETFVFAQKELIEIIHENFPEVLEPYRMEGVLDIEYDLSDARQIDDLRKAGLNMCYKVNGDFYAPMGGGITTAKTSTRVRIIVNALYHMAKDYETEIKKNEKIIKQTIQSSKPNQRSYEYKLININGQYRVIELNSQYLLL